MLNHSQTGAEVAGTPAQNMLRSELQPVGKVLFDELFVRPGAFPHIASRACEMDVGKIVRSAPGQWGLVVGVILAAERYRTVGTQPVLTVADGLPAFAAIFGLQLVFDDSPFTAEFYQQPTLMLFVYVTFETIAFGVPHILQKC